MSPVADPVQVLASLESARRTRTAVIAMIKASRVSCTAARKAREGGSRHLVSLIRSV